MRLAALLLAVAALPAAENPVAWSFKTMPKKPVKAGATLRLRLLATIERGWHLYALDQPAGGPIATEISLAGGLPFELGAVTGSKPHLLFDPNFDMQVGFYTDKVEFNVPVKAAPDARPGRRTLRVEARYQSCSGTLCLPPKTVTLEVPVDVQ